MFSYEGRSVASGIYTKGQWGSKKKDGYRAEIEIELCGVR
jgi:hypothetical protein